MKLKDEDDVNEDSFGGPFTYTSKTLPHSPHIGPISQVRSIPYFSTKALVALF